MADDFENRLVEAMRERDRATTDERTYTSIDGALRNSLQERGVALGDPWEQPHSLVRAYPKRWLVLHDDHYWLSTCSAAMSEPADDNEDWERNDPNEEADAA